jgi:hypothetical protein
LRTWLSQLHVIGAEKLAAHLAHRNRCTATFSREQEDFNNSTKTLEAISLAAELAAAPTTARSRVVSSGSPRSISVPQRFSNNFQSRKHNWSVSSLFKNPLYHNFHPE